MIKECIICEKKFEGRIDKKCCSDKCRAVQSRDKRVTDNPSVTLSEKEPVTLNKCKYCGILLTWDIQEVCYKCCLARKGPYRRPEIKQSILEKKSLKELEETWIPNWKRSGSKSRAEALKSLWDIVQQHEGRYVFQGYKIDTTK